MKTVTAPLCGCRRGLQTPCRADHRPAGSRIFQEGLSCLTEVRSHTFQGEGLCSRSNVTVGYQNVSIHSVTAYPAWVLQEDSPRLQGVHPGGGAQAERGNYTHTHTGL